MMVLSIYSPDDRYTSTYIDNYTNLYVLDELKRVPGANRASVFGLPDIAMRVWLQPDRMAQLGITVQEVTQPRCRARTRRSASARSAASRRCRARSRPSSSPRRACSPSPSSSRTSSCAPARKAPPPCACATSAASSSTSATTRSSSRMNGKIVDHDRDLPAARRQRRGDGHRRAQAPRGAEAAVSDRPRLPDRARHQPLHAELDREGRAHVLRGGGAGGARRVRVPAVAARDDHSDPRGAGVDRRHLRRHAPARLLDQHADDVRPDPGDRPRRRRRDRGGRERRGQHGGQEPVAAGGRQARR